MVEQGMRTGLMAGMPTAAKRPQSFRNHFPKEQER